MLSDIFQLLAVAVAVVMIVVGVRARRRIRAFNERAIAVDAVVVGSRASNVEHGSTLTVVHFVEVRFTTKDGRVVTASGPGSDTPPVPGSTRTVLYDPQSPSDVSFHGPRGRVRIPEMLVGGGALFVIAIVTMRVAMNVWR